MNNSEILDNLKDLVKLYLDSTWNYERAIDQIQDDDMRVEITGLHDEHQEHIDNLKSYIKQLGEKTPKLEFAGEMSPELVAITSDMNDEQVIRTLRNNEKVLNAKLQEIVNDIQVPELVHDLEEDIEDEKIFIETLQNFMS